jgi:hypothetical protein
MKVRKMSLSFSLQMIELNEKLALNIRNFIRSAK